MMESIRLQAATYVPDALLTLGTLARGQMVGEIETIKDSTVRAAARDILEIAGGRPETRDPRVGDPSQQVHIYVQRFGSGADSDFERVVAAVGLKFDDAPAPIQIQKRHDQPTNMPSVSKTYVVPDDEPMEAEVIPDEGQ